MKEMLGIVIGIAIFVGMFLILANLSKDEQKGRTVPVLQYEWEKAEFDDETIQKLLTDLDVKNLHGFLFRKDSQTAMYYPVFIGKSLKGKDAVKAVFPEAKSVLIQRKERETSALKLLGEDVKEYFAGKRSDSKGQIDFSNDYLIITFPPETTNVFLDEIQMEHFLHRYFKKKKKSGSK